LDRAGGEAVIAGTEGPAVAPLEWAGGMLGVRPEHVLLARDGPFTTRVESVEYLGADSLLLCRIGEQILTARVAGRIGLAAGDCARLSWARGASHFFDAATGIRLATEPIHQDATMLA
jgi:sn-glycerol 3-phosphate transport system ATP-binding protein